MLHSSRAGERTRVSFTLATQTQIFAGQKQTNVDASGPNCKRAATANCWSLAVANLAYAICINNKKIADKIVRFENVGLRNLRFAWHFLTFALSDANNKRAQASRRRNARQKKKNFYAAARSSHGSAADKRRAAWRGAADDARKMRPLAFRISFTSSIFPISTPLAIADGKL